MTVDDLQYLKNATPAELMALTNGVPWQLCCWVRVELTQPLSLNSPATRAAETGKWVAAGAVRAAVTEIMEWVRDVETGSSCPECGGKKQSGAKRRFTFTREAGFGWHSLCARCCEDFDIYYEPLKLELLRRRWQGRCLRPLEARSA